MYEDDLPLILHGNLRKQMALDYALTDPKKDMVCSPLAALVPLAKLLIAATGPCREQLEHAVGVHTPSEVKARFQPLMKDLRSLTGMTVAVLSRIYVSNKHQIQSLFKNYVKDIFTSSVKGEDLSNAAQLSQKINKWISSKTQSAISVFIDKADICAQEGAMMIFNTIYFSGMWKHVFTVTDKKENAMMTRSGRYKYLNSGDFNCQIVEIPFTEDKASFIIFVPNMKDNFSLMLYKLKTAPDRIQAALNGMTKRYLRLTIPRFWTSSDIDLAKEYQKLGLTNIFNKNASGLTEVIKGDSNLFVTNAVQKVVIKVNECGVGSHYVETRARPTLEMAPLSEIESPINVTAELPFLYIIKVNKEIVVTGIYNPK